MCSCASHLEGKSTKRSIAAVIFFFVTLTLKLKILNLRFFHITLLFAWWLFGVCGSLGVGHLHPLDVLLADDLVLYQRLWVVLTNNAACCLLDAAWGFPGLIEILSWKLLQLRKVLSLKVKQRKTIFKLMIIWLIKTWDFLHHDLTWCSHRFCLSSCRMRQGSRPWRTGERKYLLKATASSQH